MRFTWFFVCLLALSACKSESSAPEQSEGEPTALEVAGSMDKAPPAEPAPVEAAAPAEPATPTPVAEPEPDPNAPANVAAAPKGAKRSKSGLAWKRLKKGKGKVRPSRLDTVTVHYTGWTPNGVRFDTSARFDDGLEVPVRHLIPGLSESLQMMVAGEKRRVWIPAAIGYGEPGSNPEPAPTQPLGDLVFDVELLDVEKAPTAPPAPKDVGAIPADAERSASGLAWRVLEPGSGSDHPIDTSVVEMSYTVWNTDGEAIEGSFLRSGMDTLGISRLVPGWTEGMKLMVEGERRLFWIPENIAYAGQSYAPPGMLVVDVKLIQIRQDIHQVR